MELEGTRVQHNLHKVREVSASLVVVMRNLCALMSSLYLTNDVIIIINRSNLIIIIIIMNVGHSLICLCTCVFVCVFSLFLWDFS